MIFELKLDPRSGAFADEEEGEPGADAGDAMLAAALLADDSMDEDDDDPAPPDDDPRPSRSASALLLELLPDKADD